MIHTNRNNNKSAHWMAKSTLAYHLGVHDLICIPYELMSLLYEDSGGFYSFDFNKIQYPPLPQSISFAGTVSGGATCEWVQLS